MPDWPLLDNTLLTTTTVSALELAAARRDERPVNTLDILLGIFDSDLTSGWESVQVQSTFVAREDLGRFTDPAAEPAGTWHNVPLTGTATTAVRTAERIAEQYKLAPMPPAVLALGILAEPESAASQALLEESDVDHRQLLSLIQSDVLDTNLEGLEVFDMLGIAAPRPPGSTAPPEGSPAGPEQLLDRARQISGESGPGSVELLIAAVEVSKGSELGDLLEGMFLDEELLRELARLSSQLEDVPAQELLDAVRVRFDQTPDAPTTIVGVGVAASPRLVRVLRKLALTPAEVAGQVGEWRMRQLDPNHVSRRVVLLSLVNLAFSFLAPVLLLIDAISDHAWLELLLVIPMWWGYPREGPVVGLVIAAAVGWLASPLVGAVQAAGVLAEVLQADAERKDLWARTGIRLSLREQRHVVQRLLNRSGRTLRFLRQMVEIRLRGGI